MARLYMGGPCTDLLKVMSVSLLGYDLMTVAKPQGKSFLTLEMAVIKFHKQEANEFSKLHATGNFAYYDVEHNTLSNFVPATHHTV
jgi:hypothetical protein